MKAVIVLFGMARNPGANAEAIKNIYSDNQSSFSRLSTVCSFNVPTQIQNLRSGEIGIEYDPTWALQFSFDTMILTKQDDALVDPFMAYAQKKRDQYKDSWSSVRNLLHQLLSLKRAWAAVLHEKLDECDYFLFLRPDLLYMDKIDIYFIARQFVEMGSIALPIWHSFGGYNDRFAICDRRAAECYANRIDLFIEFCSSHGAHSEGLLAYALRRSDCSVFGLTARARRVRATGIIVREDFSASIANIPILSHNEKETEVLEILPTASTRRSPMSDIETKPQITVPGQTSNTIERNGVAALQKLLVNGFPRVSPLSGIDYIRFLATVHLDRNVERYFEIGTQYGPSLNCARKQAVAVDPKFLFDKEAWRSRPGIQLFEMTSDDFFATHNPATLLGGAIDLAFIDGMHLSEYVLRDFINTEVHCAPGGIIVLHDVIPQNFEMAERRRNGGARKDRELANAWTGDVWRVLPILQRERPLLQIDVLDCKPTGLAIISNLDPTSRKLAYLANDLEKELTRGDPPEAEFWSFIADIKLISSRKPLKSWLKESS